MQLHRRLAAFGLGAAFAIVLSSPLSARATPLSTPKSGETPACACHDVDPRSDFWKPFIEGQDQTCL